MTERRQERIKKRQNEGHEQRKRQKSTKSRTSLSDKTESERERWRCLTWPPLVKINHKLQSVLKCRPAARGASSCDLLQQGSFLIISRSDSHLMFLLRSDDVKAAGATRRPPTPVLTVRPHFPSAPWLPGPQSTTDLSRLARLNFALRLV